MVTLCREAESLSLPLLSGRQPGGAGSGNFWELKGEEEVLRSRKCSIITRSVSANDKFVQFNARKKKERKYNKDSVS